MRIFLNIFLLASLLFLSSCTEQQKEAVGQSKEKSPLPIASIQSKHAPADQFFLQRSFPDFKLAPEVYTRALELAKSQALPRDGFPHFNRDWQCEGPANLGARINTVAIHPDNDNIIFVGYSSGGIFRTLDGGKHWQPVFDDQLFLAVSDIVFDKKNPNTIYVGTGDRNITGFVALGDGLYKSTDLGANWEYLGLKESRIISKILIHPDNNQVIYVATMGLPFEKNEHRGLYRTKDGGKNWEQILYPGNQTGVIDFVLMPDNPDIILAAAWDRFRSNQVTVVSGAGCKIYRSTDGGNHWQIVTEGLPATTVSRIGLAADSQKVLAVIADENTEFAGLFQSTNQGITWQKQTTLTSNNGFNPQLWGQSGWYFGTVFINPSNTNDISILGIDSYRSTDGGDSWQKIDEQSLLNVHKDAHDLVFDHSGRFLLATDGGLYRASKDGTGWEDMENIPASQVYHGGFNPFNPAEYTVGVQDNGVAFNAVRQMDTWIKMYGGDGFRTVFHPADSLTFFVESQRGNIIGTPDGGNQWFNGTEGIATKDRKNWDLPFFISPHPPYKMYAATHRVYQSSSNGKPYWTPISNDLTSGENNLPYGLDYSISVITQSPVKKELLFAGTSDGKVWKSNDEGTTWQPLQGLPLRYVTDIVPSPDDENVLFAAVSGYRDNDFTPHIFRSDDAGSSWYPVSGNLPPLAINRIVVIPNTNHESVFVATDGGVYGTMNGGDIWGRLGENLPVMPVFDLDWNQPLNRLMASTYARGLWTYDLQDIVLYEENTLSTKEELTRETPSPIQLFPNPVHDILFVQFDNPQPTDRYLILEMFDQKGMLIRHTRQAVGNRVEWEVNVNDLAPGAYFLQIRSKNTNRTASFVKI